VPHQEIEEHQVEFLGSVHFSSSNL
jgi:hypothetical protein